MKVVKIIFPVFTLHTECAKKLLILTGLQLRDNETDILDSDDSCISLDDTLEINTLMCWVAN